MPWFKRADGVVFHILEQYEDTLARIRAEGWKEIDPRAPAASTIEPETVAAQVEVVTPASSPERAAPSKPSQADTSDKSDKPAPVAKRAPVKPKTVRKRTPVRRPAAKTTARKAAS